MELDDDKGPFDARRPPRPGLAMGADIAGVEGNRKWRDGDGRNRRDVERLQYAE